MRKAVQEAIEAAKNGTAKRKRKWTRIKASTVRMQMNVHMDLDVRALLEAAQKRSPRLSYSDIINETLRNGLSRAGGGRQTGPGPQSAFERSVSDRLTRLEEIMAAAAKTAKGRKEHERRPEGTT